MKAVSAPLISGVAGAAVAAAVAVSSAFTHEGNARMATPPTTKAIVALRPLLMVVISMSSFRSELSARPIAIPREVSTSEISAFHRGKGMTDPPTEDRPDGMAGRMMS
jgi:hypothetical protein